MSDPIPIRENSTSAVCMQLAIMRLKDATFASRREAAFHAFLKNVEEGRNLKR